MIQQRKKGNSSKVNLIISVTFHTVLVVAIVFFAAREGLLGKQFQKLTVVMVPKEKKPEPPKPKPDEPKPETPKPETPKTVIPQPKAQVAVAPPAAAGPPSVAPAAAAGSLASFEFSDGAHAVESISNPNGVYKALVEHSLRTKWSRPENIADDNYAAEVELTIDKNGKILSTRWVSGSGDAVWDNSVKTAVAQTKSLSRPPPKGFPEKIIVRFDVESIRTEPAVQLSSSH
jgi:outer membrane biosynthesis protein TonB